MSDILLLAQVGRQSLGFLSALLRQGPREGIPALPASPKEVVRALEGRMMEGLLQSGEEADLDVAAAE